MKIKTILLAMLLASFSLTTHAQNDESGCKDHPLFTRMKSFYITSCVTEYGEAEFVGAGYKLIGGTTNLTRVEGNKTVITYKIKEDAAKVSALQIRRNYGNAIKASGGKVIMETNEWDFGNADLITMQQTMNGRTIWASVYINHFTDGSEYTLTVMEPEEMQQEVQASALLKELNEKGFIRFQINFANNSAALNAEANEVVEKIIGLMKEDPNLKIQIEGHTDNVGNAAQNLQLSTARAKAVMTAVANKGGIEQSRMLHKGYGQTKPIADNTTSEGKAKNRRVEIVKL